MIQNHIRYIIGPLQRFLRITRSGTEIQPYYFLYSSSCENIPMIAEYCKMISFREIRFYENLDDQDLLEKACVLWQESEIPFSLIITIRLDLFFTRPLRESDMDMMVKNMKEDIIHIGEDVDLGIMISTPSIMSKLDGISDLLRSTRRKQQEAFRTFFIQKKLQSQWLSIVAVRILENGTIHPADKDKCPYLDDLLMEEDLSTSYKIL